MSAQETQTERGAVMLTPPEKRAVKLVSAAHNATESDTLRRGVEWVMAEADRIRAALGTADPTTGREGAAVQEAA